MCSPETVEDVAVGINPQHDVISRCVVDEGALGVDEEDVRNPNLLHEPRVKRPAQVVSGRKRQPLVFPVVTQVKSHGEVLHAQQQRPFIHNHTTVLYLSQSLLFFCFDCVHPSLYFPASLFLYV